MRKSLNTTVIAHVSSAFLSTFLLGALLIAAPASTETAFGKAQATKPVGEATRSTKSARIVGGSKPAPAVYANHFASTVALIDPDTPTQLSGVFCGGTLISPEYVLTAAHCVTDTPPFSLDLVRYAPNTVTVLAGKSRLSARSNPARELVPAKDIFIHPKYDPYTSGWDAALLHLSKPIEGVPTADILAPSEEQALGVGVLSVKGQIAGWGDRNVTALNPDCCYPEHLITATVPIHPSKVCRSNLRNAPDAKFEAQRELCAGQVSKLDRSGRTLKGGVDSCQGDSGGPLFAQIARRTVLAGITSHGVGCGERYYGVYTRVSALNRWINAALTETEEKTSGPSQLRAPQLEITKRTYNSVSLSVASNGHDAAVRDDDEVRGYSVWRRETSHGFEYETLVKYTSEREFTLTATPSGFVKRANRFVVRAAGDLGDGPAAVITAHTLSDITPPTAPKITKIVRSGSDLIVRWKRAKDIHSGINYYELQARDLKPKHEQSTKRAKRRWVNLSRSESTRFTIATNQLPYYGDRVQLRIRAVDKAGNPSRWTVFDAVL